MFLAVQNFKLTVIHLVHVNNIISFFGCSNCMYTVKFQSNNPCYYHQQVHMYICTYINLQN